MTEGTIVFIGKPKEAGPYFEKFEFEEPGKLWNPADKFMFYLRLY